jgi:chromosome segregation protein
MGFKSFGHKTVLDFQPGVTAIIGPNGSGKSNICDAIRWVLGEQSPKALRGTKMAEVIFAGSNQIRPSAFAQVKLTLDNESRRMPIDYTEISLGRQLHRSGESNYLFNGERSLLSDIREMLMDTGIGKEGYSVIGQGDIDDIIFQKTTTRRALIEEAAGITKFKHRKAGTLQKLDNTRSNITRLRDIVSEIENQLGPLEEQAEKAKKYQILFNEIRTLEVDLLLFDLTKYYEECEHIDSMRRGISAKIKEIQAFLAEIDGRKLKIRESLQDLERNLESGRQDIRDRTAAIDQLRSRGSSLKEDLSSHQARRHTILEEVSLIEETVNNGLEEIQQAENALRDQETEEISVSAQVAEIETGLKKSQAELEAHLHETVQDKESSFQTAMQMADKRNRINGCNQQIQMLRRQFDKGSLEADSIGGQIAKAEEEKARTEHDLAVLLEEIAAGEKTVGEETVRLQRAERDLERNQTELASVSDQIKIFQAKRNILEDLKNRAESGIHRGVRAALSLRDRELPGICGMIGDLVTVPKGYESAFEVALGGSIQDIVTKDADTAKAAIASLKQQKAGRATFLPMDMIQSPPRIQNPRVNGCLGVALDLVEYDAKYYDIMNHLLGRVLVFETLDSGVAYSRNNRNFNRIVTLEGDIIRSSGAMTGGAEGQKGGGLLSRKRELEDLEEKIKEFLGKEKRLTSLVANLRNERNALQTLVVEKTDALNRKRQSQVFFEKTIERMNGDLVKRREEFTHFQTDFQEVETQLRKLETAVIENQAELTILEAQNAELNSTLKAMSGREESIQARIRELTSLHQEERMRLAQIAERKKSARKEIDAAGKRRRDSLERKDRAETEIQRLSAAIDAVQAEINTLQAQATADEEIRRQAESALAGIQDQYRLASRELEHLDQNYLSRAKMEDSSKNKLAELDVKYAEIKTHIQNKEATLVGEFHFDLQDGSLSLRKYESRDQIQNRITELRFQREALEPVNPLAIDDFEKTKDRYDFLNGQITDMTEAAASLEQVIAEIEKISCERFLATFSQIGHAFTEIFQILFPGGNAHLKLVSPEDPLESGIDIACQLPGKKLTTLELFSGGEKSLISIALLFSILQVKPPAFCLLDEVEAALDEANVRRFTKLLRAFADKTQFLVITHNKETMQAVDTIYGITLEKTGISRPISIRLEDQDKITEFSVPGKGRTQSVGGVQ